MSSVVFVNNAGGVTVRWPGWGIWKRMPSAVPSNGSPVLIACVPGPLWGQARKQLGSLSRENWLLTEAPSFMWQVSQCWWNVVRLSCWPSSAALTNVRSEFVLLRMTPFSSSHQGHTRPRWVMSALVNSRERVPLPSLASCLAKKHFPKAQNCTSVHNEE